MQTWRRALFAPSPALRFMQSHSDFQKDLRVAREGLGQRELQLMEAPPFTGCVE